LSQIGKKMPAHGRHQCCFHQQEEKTGGLYARQGFPHQAKMWRQCQAQVPAGDGLRLILGNRADKSAIAAGNHP
jgi:hypothetical protein